MLGKYENIDRRTKEPNLEPVDVLLFTLDEETYLERCLDSVYREIPVNRVLVLDGGSKDKTLEILKKYPRMEIHVRPDIKTTGKGCEFMFSRATTPWLAIIEAHIELPAGWYDEMVKHKDKYDFFGCKRIMHYEFRRVDPFSPNTNRRPQGAPWLARLDCFKNYHVDDDFMWRATDMLLRQVAEKDGYRYGEVAATYHYHHTTDNPMYESDKEKRGSRLVFEEPRIEISNEINWGERVENLNRAIVKYIEPQFYYPHVDDGLLSRLMKLDMEWIKETNIEWYNLVVEYKKKRHLKRKIRVVIEYTLIFLGAIRRSFKEYIKNLAEN